MCWIQLWPSVYHSSLDSWATSKNISNSTGKKFRPNLLHHLCNSSQLPLEFHREVFLDLFDALNLAVISVCPWHSWLMSYKRKYSQFLRVKNSHSFYSSPPTSLSTIIRIPFWIYLMLWIWLHPLFVHGYWHWLLSYNRNVQFPAGNFYIRIWTRPGGSSTIIWELA